MAKTEDSYVLLQRSFATRQVSKRYEAVCQAGDKPIPDQGIIDLPLLPNPLDRPRQMVDYKYGKAATTRFEVVKRFEDGRVGLNLYPETGRTHQLRVHCAHPDGLGAAIVGDPLYGTAADRMYLHAAALTFSHPVTGVEMHFSVHSRWF
jgi:tRNA pseudouridine32 synthase/23S rRNA pseudouridine746 synthase